MNYNTFGSFSKQVSTNIFFEKISNLFVNALKEGWNGPEGNKQHWMGQGANYRVRPVDGAGGAVKSLGRMGRAGENLSSLGGLTKYLPVGSKGVTALSTGLMLPGAMAAQDPSGQQRSRTERMSGLAGNVVGGLMGSSLMMKALPGSKILAPILGGTAGSMIGDRIGSTPFAAARKAKMRAQQQQYYQPQAQQINPGSY